MLELVLDSFWFLYAVLDEFSLGHAVLLHSLEQGQHGLGFAHASHSHDLIVLVDVVGKELSLAEVSLDDDLLVADGIVSNELKGAVVHARPEEGDALVRHVLVHHVEGCVGALLKSHDPMFDPGARAGGPVGNGCDITSCVDVRLACLHERIAYKTTIRVHFNARFGEELGVGANTCAKNDKVRGNFTAIAKCHACDFAVFALVGRFEKNTVVDFHAIVLMLFLVECTNLFSKLKSKWKLITIDNLDIDSFFEVHLEGRSTLRANERGTDNHNILCSAAGLLDLGLVLLRTQGVHSW